MYDTCAYPTMYRERRYRSRLEARWAAFFDQLGWPFEYEPYDLGLWSPDFLLRGHNNKTILVEVKPISEKDEAVCQKMADAANATGFTGDLLLLGVSPVIPQTWCEWLGWLHEVPDAEEELWMQEQHPMETYHRYRPRDFEPCISVRAPNGRIDFGHSTMSYAGRITGAYDGDHHISPDSADAARSFWDAACNAVQWPCSAARF